MFGPNNSKMIDVIDQLQTELDEYAAEERFRQKMLGIGLCIMVGVLALYFLLHWITKGAI